ncbi:MAG: hypothetical protein COX45_01675 [Candidatus Portnoybacteria bacterium CG23_combo_of_CG06-09_8_20_14_all_44_36]|uniref:Uncharacterized protein n=1 Tax=Candidatus Portnoybacteria bacterium CG_4_9_14_3_um_filter_43_11 TaxID=1974805 RepID=A0A2M7YLF8_9BACT|nr:MAG: hypothetical protein COX45_01675 [Candidatus Portnoybacteria bacterium CG23_combo_of_CG06-09_8_20_14_all_44_36]PJA63818.1 MAG: hypothetical protein CO160_01890 [Candidatus Portnoybacteria bacterium CG_4_9_14_3_um_filter_43_11]
MGQQSAGSRQTANSLHVQMNERYVKICAVMEFARKAFVWQLVVLVPKRRKLALTIVNSKFL